MSWLPDASIDRLFILFPDPWPKARGADLRKFVIQALERHIEKRLVTAGMLEKGGF